jgi:hypothetical protein
MAVNLPALFYIHHHCKTIYGIKQKNIRVSIVTSFLATFGSGS